MEWVPLLNLLIPFVFLWVIRLERRLARVEGMLIGRRRADRPVQCDCWFDDDISVDLP